MDLLGWMQPRSPRAAARVVATLAGVAATTTVLTFPLHEQQIEGLALVVGVVLLLYVIALGVVAHRFDERHRLAWAVAPVIGVPVLTGINLVTGDASVTAQIFFIFPVLYGASQLRPAGAVVMTALAVTGDILVVALLLPPREALVDAWYVVAALGTTAILLTVISERNERLVRRLEEVASLDALTGLSTRRVFDETADEVLAHAVGGSLMLLDVDHFKAVNDRYGHPAGDRVLAELASILLARSRQGDVVCRIGGDEMAVLLPGCSYPGALERAEQILADTRGHAFELGSPVPVPISISVGVAHLSTHAHDLRTLYSAADTALYTAKQRGRGQVVGAGEPGTVPPLADTA